MAQIMRYKLRILSKTIFCVLLLPIPMPPTTSRKQHSPFWQSPGLERRGNIPNGIGAVQEQ